MRDKVTRQCPQTTTHGEKGEPKRIRTEVPPLTSLTARPNRRTFHKLYRLRPGVAWRQQRWFDCKQTDNWVTFDDSPVPVAALAKTQVVVYGHTLVTRQWLDTPLPPYVLIASAAESLWYLRYSVSTFALVLVHLPYALLRRPQNWSSGVSV